MGLLYDIQDSIFYRNTAENLERARLSYQAQSAEFGSPCKKSSKDERLSAYEPSGPSGRRLSQFSKHEATW